MEIWQQAIGARTMKIAIATLSLLMIAGCATTPTPPDSAKLVSPEKLYAYQERNAQRSSKITAIRDGGFTGSGCDIVFYIDGEKAAIIGPRERASFYVPDGVVNLGAGLTDSGLCSGAAIRTISATADSSRESFFRISGDVGGFYLSPYVNYSGR